MMNPLADWIDTNCAEATNTYPTTWPTRRHLARNVLETFMASSFSMEFAELFRGFSLEQLDEAAKSFAFTECKQREGLNKILSEHKEVHGKKA